MSAELKATPGPWQRHDTPDYAEIHPAAGKQHSAVALVAKLDDAHLIAAAPKVYGELADAISFIEHIAKATGYPSDANAREEYGATLDRYRAALALARGEQQS